jgi:nucleoid DNA-binding protein
MNKEISKKIFWRYVNSKIKRKIHHYHVFAIISILFEEIVKDLLNNKEIKIFNFGTLSLNKTKAKKYYDVRFQKVMQSTGSRILKFELSKKIKKKLINYLDVDATFGSD